MKCIYYEYGGQCEKDATWEAIWNGLTSPGKKVYYCDEHVRGFNSEYIRDKHPFAENLLTLEDFWKELEVS